MHPRRTIFSPTNGVIDYPTVGHFASIYRSVQRHFPGDDIWMAKSDIDAWYKRLLLSSSAMCLATTLLMLDDQPHVMIPIVIHCGIQDYSYFANFGSNFIRQIMACESLRHFGLCTRSIYSDD
jgi:hypothetical protein